MKLRLTLVLLFLPMVLKAQFDAQLSQYWAMPNYYNAGATGRGEALNIVALTRQQWVGMPNAPKSFLISTDMPIKLFKRKTGIGLVLFNETIGLFTNMNLSAHYAHKMKLWGGELSLGLQLGIIDQRFDGTKISIPSSDGHNPSEEGMPTTELQGMAFDAAFGAYYTLRNYYVGVSCTHLTEPNINFDEKTDAYIGRLYYLMGGCNIPIKNSLYELQPSFLFKTNLQSVQVEATARVLVNKMFFGGLSYRWNDAVVVSIGAQIKNFTLGYSYDITVSQLARASSGSHEIFAGYKMKIDLSEKGKNKYKSIRIL